MGSFVEEACEQERHGFGHCGGNGLGLARSSRARSVVQKNRWGAKDRRAGKARPRNKGCVEPATLVIRQELVKATDHTWQRTRGEACHAYSSGHGTSTNPSSNSQYQNSALKLCLSFLLTNLGLIKFLHKLQRSLSSTQGSFRDPPQRRHPIQVTNPHLAVKVVCGKEIQSNDTSF